MSRFLLCGFAIVSLVSSAPGQWIDTVSILPPSPTDLDWITISVRYELGHTGIDLIDTQLDQSGSNLSLDLYFHDDGWGFLEFRWDRHDQPVGCLTPGQYSVTVTSYRSVISYWEWQQEAQFQDGFTVLPEPGTMLLLFVAGLVALPRRKRAST